MKTNKRILSAVLASTVALSSYAAYAETGESEAATINLSAGKATKEPTTITGDELKRYNTNLAKYTVEDAVTDANGDFTVNVKGKFGEMKGTANAESQGKDVLIMLAFDKDTDFTIKKGETSLNEAVPEWKTDAPLFVTDTEKTYFTLWVSATDDRVTGSEKVEYTITVGEVTKNLTVTFEDETAYTLTAPAAAAEDKYTVTIANGSTNSKKITLTPKAEVEIKSATVKGVTLTKDTGKNSFSGEIDVKTKLTSDQIAAGTTELALAAGDFTVATVENKIHLVGAGKSTKPTDTMTDDENARLTYNNGKITIGNVVTDAEGNYTITVDTKFGEMRGNPAAEATDGKNALIMLEFNAEDEINIKKQGAGSDLPAEWKTDADKFVTAADGKQYFTLWVSVTDDRIADDNGVKYTIHNTQGGQTQEKTLTVKFTDSTKYTLNVGSSDSEANFKATVGSVNSNGEALVTVTPKNEGETITAAKLKMGDGSELTLTPLTEIPGSYGAKVAVKNLLTSTDIQNGVVEKTLTAEDFEVTVAAQSATMVATGMTVGIEAPSSMTGTELTRYQNNRKLYANKLFWDKDSRTATVKVPSELLDGANTGANNGANVCLILKLETALEKSGDTYGLAETGIEDIDVEDGWKFVQGATEADKGKYVVLWINAHKDALSSGNKVVIYTDDDGAVIATVNLVKVPGVKPSAAAKPTADSLTTEAIKTAAKSLLTGDVSDDNIDFAIGTLPTESGDVTVTATPKGDTVLVDAGGNVVTSLELTVSVTIAADAKYTAAIAETTNGTVALKYQADPEDTELTALPVEGVVAGTEVTIVPTANSGYKVGTVTVKNAISGETVSVSGNKFTMPIGGVTVSVTFTSNSTSSGGSSGGGSWGGGSSSGGGSGSSSTGVTLDTLPYATISDDKNAISGDVTAELKANESTTSSGVTVKTDEVEKAADGASVKIEAPKTTYDINTWSRELVKSTPSSRASEVKKSVDEAIKAVGDGNGFALYVTITKDGKSVEPDGNIEITVPVPEASKGKELHVYRITNRGAVEILAKTANDKVTFMAGGSGEYIFTTEKLTNVKTYELGNVDGDARTNAQDATLTLKYLIRDEMLKDEYLFTADADGNGLVNASDATAILKYLVDKA